MLPIVIGLYSKIWSWWKFSREAKYIAVGKGCSKKRMLCGNSKDRVDNKWPNSKECWLRAGVKNKYS